MNKFKQLWSNLRSSFWFMPSLIIIFSIALAVALIEADSVWSDRWLAQWPRLFGAGAEGARGMMSTIAGLMMTVVGVTFSMILAVFFGFVLALGGVGALMFFIHHIASSIQASSIIASVANETIQAIDRLFPKPLGQVPGEDDKDHALQPPAERKWHAVPARKSGYIQSVDNAALLHVARDRKTIVLMERGIGEFVVQDTALLEQAEWIAELAGRTIESVHDRARIKDRLARVREALEADPACCAGGEEVT